MYHELTYSEIARRRRLRIIYVLLVLIICVNIFIAFMMSQSIAKAQSTATIRESIIESAVQCCAVEGSYPSSVKHLEQNYGLVINHNDYIVNYEWLGDNVPPSVVVKNR